MKKLILTTIISLLFVGCISNEEQHVEQQHENTVTNSIIFKTDFNNEHYIWENWIFPNNKTTGK